MPRDHYSATLDKLTEEWRKSIYDRFDKLELWLKDIDTKVAGIQLTSAQTAKVEKLEERIRSLEGSRTKFIAIIGTLNFLMWIVITYLKK